MEGKRGEEEGEGGKREGRREMEGEEGREGGGEGRRSGEGREEEWHVQDFQASQFVFLTVNMQTIIHSGGSHACVRAVTITTCATHMYIKHLPVPYRSKVHKTVTSDCSIHSIALCPVQ